MASLEAQQVIMPTLTARMTGSASEPSTLLAHPTTPRPHLPKRSRRRSLVGRERPNSNVLDAPPLPLSSHLQDTPSSLTASYAIGMLPYKTTDFAQQSPWLVNASTAASAPSSPLPRVAPLNVSIKKAIRSPNAYQTTRSSPATPSSQLSHTSVSSSHLSVSLTPTIPPKSRFRKQGDSRASPVAPLTLHAQTNAQMRPYMSHKFDSNNGIGLDFGSCNPLLPSDFQSPSERSQRPTSSSSACESDTSAYGGLAVSSSETALTDRSSDSRCEDDQSHTSPSSVSTSTIHKSDGLTSAKSYDAVFTQGRFANKDFFDRAEYAATAPKHSSWLSAIPMSISRSHQEMIDGSPKSFHPNEARGLFESVRGLMDDLQLDIADGQSRKYETSDIRTPTSSVSNIKLVSDLQRGDRSGTDLRTWLASSEQNNCGISKVEDKLPKSDVTEVSPYSGAPVIKVASLESPRAVSNPACNVLPSSSFTLTEQSSDTELSPPQTESHLNTSAHSEGGASTRMRGLWGPLRAPPLSTKAAAATRSPSASSYASTSSFVPRTNALGTVNNASTSSLLSTSSFSLFSRKPVTQSAPDSHASSITKEDEVPLRLSRRQIDEDKLANTIISCAEARHVLKTDKSPIKLKEVGLKLELGWREQLAEAQQLRNSLELTQDTVEDLEDENKHLRSQLGSLSEQIVSREDDMRSLGEATAAQIAREREAVAAETKSIRADAALQMASIAKQLAEEKAVALGLGLLLKDDKHHSSEWLGIQSLQEELDRDDESRTSPGASSMIPDEINAGFIEREARSPASLLFDLPSETEEPIRVTSGDLPVSLRRSALMQARPRQSNIADDAHSSSYEELFRCPTHRFAQGAAAPPSTLVDERVLLVGTDQPLLLALAQKLIGLGLTQILLATPIWSVSAPRVTSASMRNRGVRSLNFDPNAGDAWQSLSEAARKKLGGDVDCVVNAFDSLDVERLAAISALLRQQASATCNDAERAVNSTRQPVSVVNVVYDSQYDSASERVDTDCDVSSMCAMALISLGSSLGVNHSRLQGATSARAIRLNTIVMTKSDPALLCAVDDKALEGFIRLLDPCCSVQGCVLQPDEHLRCVGPPLCPALPAFPSSPSAHLAVPSASLICRSRGSDAERQRWLKVHKRIADVELLNALETENNALHQRLQALEQSYFLLLQAQSSKSPSTFL